ncbi:hypothetical protein K0I73_04635 [Shewanella mesophila]|uniref:hypothetical protein n=1 Tax=Shewanella mesophila TaxID=2864208 RepID=UPI001C65F573|nr:hypothetical protein [Shewanella mesophila]QYJ87024.1 hypothetical protein K0I73_04635 [Shewanella mesophila]
MTEQERQLVANAERLFTLTNQKIEHLLQKLASMSGNVKSALDNEIIPLYKVTDPISGTTSELISL